MRAQKRSADADLFNLVTPQVSLHDTCNYRWAVPAFQQVSGACVLFIRLQ